MRCSRPGVPGLTHGRASVTSSRLYGSRLSSSLWSTRTSGSSSSDRGSCQGSAPFAMKPSESSITGTMYLVAMRTASNAIAKQSAGLFGARIGTGLSPLRPNIACIRSDCSVLVGMPVLGPARCTLMMISGSSTIRARPMASPLSAMPGPLLAVMPSLPPNEAPMAEVIAAISSSAWNVMTPKFLCFASSCSTGLAGVIGYEP